MRAPTDVDFRAYAYAGACPAHGSIHGCRSAAKLVSGGEGGDHRRELRRGGDSLCRGEALWSDTAAIVRLAAAGQAAGVSGATHVRAGGGGTGSTRAADAGQDAA